MQKTDLELIDAVADELNRYCYMDTSSDEEDAKLFIEGLSERGYSIVKDEK